MWRFVSRSLYLSEGGEFDSFLLTFFSISFLRSYRHSNFVHAAILSAAFASPSPHALSFSSLFSSLRLFSLANQPRYQRWPLRTIPRRKPHRRLVRCVSHLWESAALLSRPEEGGGICGFRVCGVGGVGLRALKHQCSFGCFIWTFFFWSDERRMREGTLFWVAIGWVM